MLFAALRPCVFIYLLALTLEELGHGTCKMEEEDLHATARRIVYHISTVVMLIAAFARAQSPRSESDIPFVMTVTCLAIVAILPMPSSSSHGPLSQTPKTLVDAGERILRATLFSFTYSMSVYASSPTRNVGSELLVCVGRAAAASVWILAVSPILLIAFPFQVALCIAMSLRSGATAHDHEYESVPLKQHEHGNQPPAPPTSRMDTSKRSGSGDYDTQRIVGSMALDASTTDSDNEYSQTCSRPNIAFLAQQSHHVNHAIEKAMTFESTDLDDGSLSCSSDIETVYMETSGRKYGAGTGAGSGLTFSFSHASLQSGIPPLQQLPQAHQLPVPATEPSAAMVAAAIARETNAA